MSSTPVQEPHAQLQSSDSGHTLPSKPLQYVSDQSASKRVCFYKSGDYTFSGHRMVVNARTFKTFDALLDALSKKVPLPFGVRTITTPRGTHPVKALQDLHDGGAYVCSDQKRVKPLNLDEVSRRQVPWNTTRPLSVGQLRQQGLRLSQFGRRIQATNRSTKVSERMAVRTPKRLMVIKNKDPTVKHTIVLQRRTAPTFDALLDYLSQILQFPVLKLFSTDGRRVDSLAALILCSGVVVAAGNETFRLANYSFHRPGQTSNTTYMETLEPRMLQPRAEKNKTLSNGRGSRNFSLSSERYIVNQINKSQNGSINGCLNHNNGSFETGFHQLHTSIDAYETGKLDNWHHGCIVPRDDDIEKSFRVNQDGSMTVEMKVHLTIKEEEMLHWTTTLSRSTLSKRTVYGLISESGNSSFDSNHTMTKNSSNVSDGETQQDDSTAGVEMGVGLKDGQINKSFTSTALGNAKTSLKCTPTPGHHHVDKKASVESVRMVTEPGDQESTLENYSYMERTVDGRTTEGYCVVRHNSNSNNKPIPKPRKTISMETSNKCSNSSIRSSGVAEVLQIQNNGMEVMEALMHIYETQGSQENYFANEEKSVDSVPLYCFTPVSECKNSTDSRLHSSSNDCDIDCSWQPPTADSLQQQKEEMLSLSSEPVLVTPQMTNNLSMQSQIQDTVNLDKVSKRMKKKLMRPGRNQSSSTPTSSTDITLRSSRTEQKICEHSSTEKSSSDASIRKKTLNLSDSGQRGKGVETKTARLQFKKPLHNEKMPRSDTAFIVSSEDGKKKSLKRQNTDKAVARENGHNVNTLFGRPQIKKNMSDTLQIEKNTKTKTISKTKSMTENKVSPPKISCELKESVSMPFLNPSPADIHQYVENWLENLSPDAVTQETQSRSQVVFQIGGDSESEEKNENQTHLDVCHPSPCDTFRKSTSCLSVPLCYEWAGTAVVPCEQKPLGLCVSMPSVRVDLEYLETKLRSHKSAEAICPEGTNTSSSSILSPKTKLKPVLKQLCSSIQCIRRASDINTKPNLEKSNSLPDFPTQVASVFGLSCKAFLSFLSVMTLKDGLKSSAAGDGSPMRSTSEAMLIMESLQKISAIKDGEEQRASLSDLHSRTSSQFRDRWRDFLIMQERLESETLSVKVSETEFALDVVSEGSEVFEDQHLCIDELMEKLDMPQDLRAEIASTIQEVKGLYPGEESTVLETESNQSESVDVEYFVKECEDQNKELPEVNNMCMDEGIAEPNNCNDDTDIPPLPRVSNGEHVETQEVQTLRNEQTKKEENEEVEEGEVKDFTKHSNSDEIFRTGRDNKEEAEEEKKERVEGGAESEEQKQWDRPKANWEESVEKEEEVELTEDDEEGRGGRETDRSEELERESVEGEPWGGSSIQETDEREGTEEMEGEEENDGIIEGHENLTDGLKERMKFTKVHKIAEYVSGVKVEGKYITDGMKEEEETEESVGAGVKKEVVEQVNTGVEESTGEIDEEEKEELIDDKSEVEVRESTEQDKDLGNVVGKEGEVVGVADEHKEDNEDEEQEAECKHKEEDNEEDKEQEAECEEEEDNEEEEQEAECEEENNEEEEQEAECEQEEDNEKEQEAECEEEEEEQDAECEEEDNEEEEQEAECEQEDNEEEEQEAECEQEKDNEEEEQEAECEEEDDNEEKEQEAECEEEGEEQAAECEEEEEEQEAECEEDDNEEKEQEAECEEEEEEQVAECEEEEEEQEAECEEEDNEEEEQEAECEQEEDNEEKEQEAECEEQEKDSDSVEVKSTQENCKEATDRNTGLEKTEKSVKEEFVEDKEVEEKWEIERNMQADQTVEGNEEETQAVVQLSDSDSETRNIQQMSENVQEHCKTEEAQFFHTSSSEEASVIRRVESQSKSSSEGQFEDDKGNDVDSADGVGADEEGEQHQHSRNSSSHPVEISQELLDFVNSALKASSLIFTYDSQGNLRIEPDSTRVVQTEHIVIPKSTNDSSYGFKRLPSPSTSDLSDYRPETSDSGGCRSQDSVDVVSDSGEEASGKPVQGHNSSTHWTDVEAGTEEVNSKLAIASNSETLGDTLRNDGSFSSSDSGNEALRNDASYADAAGSFQAESEAAQCIPAASEEQPSDGVLIDQGRWLLKENHLIRNSPPVSLGMYSNLDTTSTDTNTENNIEYSPHHYNMQQDPLVTISSSELEEMAKPSTPKCTYYNMPHGSDSDPFLDDSSINSRKKDFSCVKGRGFRVSPVVDTSKTWANKNGSLSSFASVEFKIPERKVHPEKQSLTMAQARRTSSGGETTLGSQDSLEALQVKCGQYCPIL